MKEDGNLLAKVKKKKTQLLMIEEGIEKSDLVSTTNDVFL